MTRTKLFFAFALVLVPLAVLTSAPAPKDKIRLAPAGKVKVDKLIVNDAALIDENRIVLVGRKGDHTDFSDVLPGFNDGVPNGAIIDLAKKSAQPFTNQHTTQIWGVSSCGGRVLTSSADLTKTFLRSWDLKTQQGREVVKFDEVFVGPQVRCFHKSDRVVMDATSKDDSVDTGLFVFDPAKPKERMKLGCPPGVKFLSGPLAVSLDDAWIACEDDQKRVVCFEVATKKATVVPIPPKDGEKWRIYSLAFSPSGKQLFVCRSGKADEVPEGKDEKDVPAERRGIVRIDLPEGRVVPLNMGHIGGPCACDIDRTGTWLATVGGSRPFPTGELRVYNLSSGKLAYNELLKGEIPGWVWFTSSGKRLVSVTNDGTVRWWDVPAR